MAKITTAQDLLKEKGYKVNKFDTNGFLEAVAGYFRRVDVKDKLLLVSKRFVEVDNALESKKFFFRELSDDEKATGWDAQTEIDANDLLGIYCQDRDLRKSLMDQLTFGMLKPRIVVDAPFFKNAVSLLQIMGGYVVEKKKRHGIDTALVSLI